MTATDEPPAAPDVTPAQAGPGRQRTGPGCLVKLAFFVAMLVLGGVAANLIRGNDGADAVTLAEGRAGTVDWRIQGRAEQGDNERCVELYQEDDEFALTGVCLPSRTQPTGADLQETSPSGTAVWVLFGPAPPAAERVELTLSDGSTETVDVQTKDGWDDPFYVFVPPAADVNADGPAVFQDAGGQEMG